MIQFYWLPNIRAIGSLLIILLFANCKKEKEDATAELNSPIAVDTIVGSQTRTASFLNNLNNFQDVFGDQGYPGAKPENVSANDDIFASATKLTTIGSSSSSLALQGFGFTIPDKATIKNIALKVRRFKSGSPAIGDFSLSLMQRYQCGAGPCTYGVFWTHLDDYPGRMYPDTETEYVFSQSGTGNRGGFKHDEAYQWTAAIVNHQFFGVRIDSNLPSGEGSVVVNYDFVEITVEYSVP